MEYLYHNAGRAPLANVKKEEGYRLWRGEDGRKWNCEPRNVIVTVSRSQRFLPPVWVASKWVSVPEIVQAPRGDAATQVV
jgi:hypothetical protein